MTSNDRHFLQRYGIIEFVINRAYSDYDMCKIEWNR